MQSLIVMVHFRAEFIPLKKIRCSGTEYDGRGEHYWNFNKIFRSFYLNPRRDEIAAASRGVTPSTGLVVQGLRVETAAR